MILLLASATVFGFYLMNRHFHFLTDYKYSSSDFGIPEERAFPMPDAAHVRAAEAYFRYASDDQKPELARNILEKAAEYGVRVESPVVLSWAGK